MGYMLGIDLGTSYFKFGIYDPNLSLKGLCSAAVEKDTGDGNLCRVACRRFAELLKKGIADCVKQSGIGFEEIDTIGYSSQANSFILLDAEMRPLTELILWPDLMFPDVHPKLRSLWGRSDFLERTGLGIEAGPNFCINKLCWIKEQKPKLWGQVRSVMTISDYLSYLLSGEKIGDVGTASLLGLLDCKGRDWWDEAFDVLEIDKGLFSKRLSVGSVTDCSGGELLQDLGFKKNTALCIGSLDHHMAALGAGLSDAESMSLSIGTVVACVNITEDFTPTEGVCISPWREGQYCQLTFDANGAVCLEWYHRHFADELSFEALMDSAREAGGSGGLKALPGAFNYATREEAFEGIESFHGHGHFIYALMESCGETASELVSRLFNGGKPGEILATGGGAKNRLWLNIISGKTGCKVTGSLNKEPATLGSVKLLKRD